MKQAEKNVTHKYNADWSHLDDWEVLDWEWDQINDPDGYDVGDDGVAFNYVIKVKGSCTDEEFYQVMADEYRRGCSCEHDCCGHYFGGVHKIRSLSEVEFDMNSDRKRLNPAYVVTASYNPNY